MTMPMWWWAAAGSATLAAAWWQWKVAEALAQAVRL